jgi:hypothetical protein
MKAERAVLTLAFGKRDFLKMAHNLARSFLFWHRTSDIRFYLATDSDTPLPSDLAGISVIKLKPGQYGGNFSPKLHLDLISPARETLFVDSDCLCAANLEKVFEKFQACDIAVIGRKETEGEFWGDIAFRRRAAGVAWIPRFNGGMYYFKHGKISAGVFETARELEKRYDELGMVRLRGVPNEEPLLGLAMAMANQPPLADDGSIKGEPLHFSGWPELNIFTGYARLANRPGRPSPYPDVKLPNEIHPAVVHFVASHAYPPYTTEALRLEKVMKEGWPLFPATAYAWLTCTLPFTVATKTKDILRPYYVRLFGHRTVKRSPQI